MIKIFYHQEEYSLKQDRLGDKILSYLQVSILDVSYQNSHHRRKFEKRSLSKINYQQQSLILFNLTYSFLPIFTNTVALDEDVFKIQLLCTLLTSLWPNALYSNKPTLE